MGWDVTATSELGVGSTFSVVMAPPSSEPNPVPVITDAAISTVIAAHSASTGHGSTLRVLVIDDELDARTILKSQLEELGCEVVTAEHAPVARRAGGNCQCCGARETRPAVWSS